MLQLKKKKKAERAKEVSRKMPTLGMGGSVVERPGGAAGRLERKKPRKAGKERDLRRWGAGRWEREAAWEVKRGEGAGSYLAPSSAAAHGCRAWRPR